MDKGYDVKVSEVHGMSQRGGSVVTYVRFGDKVYSPIIDRGGADYIISFELLEAARYTEFLKPGGQIVTSTQQIDPMPVIAGTAKYPEELIEKMTTSEPKSTRLMRLISPTKPDLPRRQTSFLWEDLPTISKR